MTQIIAFTGPAGCGKDLVTEIMTSQMIRRDPSVSIRSLSFAAPIKLAVACILNCDVDDFNDRKFKEGSLLGSHGLATSPRQMMQLLGDEYGRQLIDDQIWIKTAQNNYDDACDKGADFVFITDLRYTNEHEWVLENGGVVIYIDRQDVAPVATHASESGLSNAPCFCIDNNSCIDDLRNEVLEMTCILQRPPVQRVSIDECSPSEWDLVARRCNRA